MKHNPLLPVLPKDITLLGQPDNWVDRDQVYNLTCRIGKVKPAGTIHWMIDGEVVGADINTSVSQHAANDGTFSLSKSVNHQFQGAQYLVNVSCQVAIGDANIKFSSGRSKMVSVYCKYLYMQYTYRW